MQSGEGRFLERMNPAWKGLAVLLCALLLSLSASAALNLLVFAAGMALLAACSRARPRTVLPLLLPVALLAAGLLLTGLFYSRGGAEGTNAYSVGAAAVTVGSVRSGIQLATRVFAFAALGLLFSMTTDPQAFIGSLQHQAHLPPKFAYGILAAVHLLPNIRAEYRNARLALAARGAPAGPFAVRPVFTMLVNAIRWSEALSMAMESKGFNPEGPRTYYEIPTVRASDRAFCCASCALVLAGVLLLP